MKAARGFGLLMALAVALAHGRALATPVGTAFTYQGVVEKNGVGINGVCSIRFTLYDALTAGSQVGSPAVNTVSATASHGLFTATLDFGATAFNGNNARWLQIEVEGPGDQSYTTLTPRQPVSPVPYALFALNTGGTLTLPFAGSASNNGNAFDVTNSNGSGTALFGNGGLTGVEGTGVFAGVYGHSTTEYGVYGETNAGASGAVRGHNFGSGPGVEGIGGTGNGMNGTSATANGVYGTTFNSSVAAIYGTNQGGGGPGVQGQSTSGFGVWGTSSSATGVQGQSTSGWGVYGSSAGNNAGGVFGQTSVPNSSGVLGRAEANSVDAHGIFGYASSGAVGVLGISEGNDGMVARSNAAGHSGIWAYSTNASGYGAAITNTGGGVALWVSGLAQVNTLQILGSDLAESFPAGGDALEPGTVLEIVGDAAGTLRESHSEYNTRVAGVVSGANGLPAGVILEGHSYDKQGKVPVGMSGRVWVKCDATQGPIHVGDLLTTSATPGHAMRASDASRATGAILGKAMTSLESGRGLVLVLVSLQ